MLWVLKPLEIGKLRANDLISQWEVGNVSGFLFLFKLYFNEQLKVRSLSSKDSKDDS